MTNTQLAEYKKLHSKLAYNLKTANTDEAKEVWGTAMKKLKTDRNDMLEKFMQDSKLTWCTQLMHKERDTTSSGSEATTMDLNRYQMKEKLGISHLPDDSDYVKSELARYPQSQHPNPTWAAAGELIYHYSEVKHVHIAARVSETEQCQVAVPDDGAGPAGPKGIAIRWDRLVPKVAQACQKKMKSLLELIGMVSALKARTSLKGSKDEIMTILNKCENELKDKIDQWNVKLANPQMDEAGHDDMKNVKEAMDETHEATRGIIQSASNKLEESDTEAEDATWVVQ